MNILEVASQTPTLHTARLTLERITMKDAFSMYRYSHSETVTRYLTWQAHKSVFQTIRYVKLLQEKYDSAEFYDWGLREKSTGRFIGTCGFTKLSPETLCGEIGYVLAERSWGKGYAAEAAEKILEFGFVTLGLHTIAARFLYGNDRSEAVMKKLGMTSCGVLPESMYIKGGWRTVLEYRITKEEYFNRIKK